MGLSLFKVPHIVVVCLLLTACSGDSKKAPAPVAPPDSGAIEKPPETKVTPIKTSLRFLHIEGDELSGHVFDPNLYNFESVTVKNTIAGFELKDKGLFVFKGTAPTDKDVDVKVEAKTADKTYHFNIDFITYDSPVVTGYPSVSKKVREGNELFTGLSLLPSQTVNLHLNANTTSTGPLYITDVNNQIVKEVQADYKPQQPQNDEPWYKGFGFDISAEVPLEGLESGVYFVNGKEDVFFVVRNPKQDAKVTFVLPTNTQNAYSCQGGRSLYYCKEEGDRDPRVPKLSFLRPQRVSKSYSWAWDIIHLARPFIQWMNLHSGYGQQVQYITDADLDNLDEFAKSQLLVIAAHNEYWTLKAQDNFNQYLDSGKNALIAGGNIMWWNTRYEDEGRVLTSFKGNPLDDKEAEKGKETSYFHMLKDDDGFTRSAIQSIGGVFTYGGYEGNKWDGKKASEPNPFRVIRPNAAIFSGADMTMCSNLDLSNNHEMDGPVINGFDVNGFPSVQYTAFKYIHNYEVLAYTWGYRAGHTVATIHAFQRKPESGTVLQISSNGATSFGFKNNNAEQYKKVLNNVFSIMAEGKYEFESESLYQAKLAHEMTFPYKGDKIPNIEACPL